jgi:hypothetical protein
MKNVHVLPTDKPSRLIYNDANQLCYQSNKSYKNDRKWMQRKKFNIYITSDEDIKKGEYQIYNPLGNFDNAKVSKAERLLENDGRRKKIILTTDPELVADGVQAIDDAFLEWFVKNPTCEEVKVDLLPYDGTKSISKYWGGEHKIIIPQEVSKQQTAVDWLWEQLDEILPFSVDTETGIKLYNAKEQAKEMEKEQHKHTFEESRLTHPMVGFKHDTFSEYYYETYNTTKP